MPQYFCSLPNERKAGRIPCLISDDPEAIAAFIKRWDIAGRGVYRCVNPLRDGATRRAIDTVGAIERLAVDIDFKDLAAAPAEIEQRLRSLPLTPTWVRKSGGGFHVGWELKEPIAADDAEYFRHACEQHKRLVAALSGDPAVAHPAALLRVEGTYNSKRDKPVLVETLWDNGKPVDLSEIEDDLIERLPPDGMFERKAGGNGRDRHSPFGNESTRSRPIEVDERLAAMTFKGAGETAIHTTQLQVTAALLRTGSPLEDVVADVLEATRKAARGDLRTLKWDWRQEEHDIRRMCCDFVSKAPELSAVLPEPLRTSFEAALAQGKTAKIVYARHIGWHVRSFHNAAAETQKPAEKDSTPNDPLPGWNLYDGTKIVSPRWLVEGLLPENGLVILAGQWGTFKTSTAIDLSIAVMTGQKFADQYRIKRKGAVLYFALEGAGTLMARFAAIARQRRAPDKLPLAWRSNCPQLTDKTAAATLVSYITKADAFFQKTYGVPVGLVWFDTYIAAAGLPNSGDDSDAATTQRTYNTLRHVATSTHSLVGVIDHFGKVVEAGTRGSSGKEGGADAVLAALADRELNGNVTNTRIAVRKQRDGLSGFEIPFTPEKTEIGLDEDGDPITALTLSWGKQRLGRDRRGARSMVGLSKRPLLAVRWRPVATQRSWSSISDQTALACRPPRV
jgi:AAA domain